MAAVRANGLELHEWRAGDGAPSVTFPITFIVLIPLPAQFESMGLDERGKDTHHRLKRAVCDVCVYVVAQDDDTVLMPSFDLS